MEFKYTHDIRFTSLHCIEQSSNNTIEQYPVSWPGVSGKEFPVSVF